MELTQDVNQGQTQPLSDLETNTSQTQIDSNTSSEHLEDVKDVDEKGVPYKNRIMEAQRKEAQAKEAVEFYKKAYEQQTQLIQRIQQPQQPQQPQDQELSDEQLIAIEQSPESTPETLAQVKKYREDRLIRKVLSAVEKEVVPKVKATTEAGRWEEKALQEYPDLANPESAFRQAVAQEYADLKAGGYTGPKLVYKAAQLAAKGFPTIQRGATIPQKREELLAQHNVATNISNQKNETAAPLSAIGQQITNKFGNDSKKISNRIQKIREQYGDKLARL
jgi:hypothetical protein